MEETNAKFYGREFGGGGGGIVLFSGHLKRS